MGTARPANKQGAEIAGRCRRIGWNVEVGAARAAWDYKITPPQPHAPIYIHKTPSTRLWKTYVMNDLNNAGLAEAEAEADWREAAERAAKLAADQEANHRAAKAAEKRARQAAAVAAAAGPYGGPQPLNLTWLTTPTSLMQTKPCIITPEQAGHILDTMNTHNRPLREHRWTFLVDVIRRGEWAMTHQGLAVDSNGVLQDGQHRLKAIVESKQAVPIQVTVGAPPENFLKVDTGSVRTGRDAASMRGESDPGVKSSVAKMLIHIDRFGPDAHVKSKRNPISNDAVDRALDLFGADLNPVIARAKAIKRQVKPVNVAAVSTAIYLITNRLPANDPRVEQFLEDFEYGPSGSTAQKVVDPVWHLRKRFNDSATTGRFNSWEQVAYVIKAWNHRANGRHVTVLVWRQANEVFPHNVYLPPPIDAPIDAPVDAPVDAMTAA